MSETAFFLRVCSCYECLLLACFLFKIIISAQYVFVPVAIGPLEWMKNGTVKKANPTFEGLLPLRGVAH